MLPCWMLNASIVAGVYDIFIKIAKDPVKKKKWEIFLIDARYNYSEVTEIIMHTGSHKLDH